MDYSKLNWRKVPTEREAYGVSMIPPSSSGKDMVAFKVIGLYNEVAEFEIPMSQVPNIGFNRMTGKIEDAILNFGIHYALKNCLICTPLEEII